MSKPKITVVGSLNMDIVVSMERMPITGETVSGESIHYIPGGKGANQAAGCARLGADVNFIGAVGKDEFGNRMLQQMQRFGVKTETIAALEDVPTGTATILHTREDNCIVVVAGANAECSPEQVNRYADIVRGADILIVQLEVPLSTVHQALQLAKAAGVPTVLNPAPAQHLPAELLQLVDYITPNETELALLSGRSIADEPELEQAIREWEQKYGNKLIVTRGKEGCSFLMDNRLITVPAIQVKAVDTTGAGDTFNAALSYSLASGKSVEEAAGFAVRAAALSVTKFGAQGGLPTLAEVEETYGK
ncbi:MAG: ribokinase [Paenibacillus sp.]|jgi:ribokinase|nr:ribokinase [Paenibacillus sp.]